MDSRLKKFLRQEVTVKSNTTRNAAGEMQHGTGTSVKCKVEYRETTFRDSSGAEITSKTRIFFAEDATISMEDLITLPEGEERQVLQILRKRTVAGAIDHLVVYV